jgi:hypothetical protein
MSYAQWHNSYPPFFSLRCLCNIPSSYLDGFSLIPFNSLYFLIFFRELDDTDSSLDRLDINGLDFSNTH